MTKVNKYIAPALALGLGVLSLGSCSDNNDVDRSKTVITNLEEQENAFDRWLHANFLKPYNIDLMYRFQDNESQMDRYVSPADYNKSIQFAHLAKHLCLEAYDEVTGSKDFIRKLFPKTVQLIGSTAYNSSGSILLGTAEGGRKMVLYLVNALDPSNVAAMNTYYFQTIHHEFGHIQNQTKPYPSEFEQITPRSYVADSWTEAWGARTANVRQLAQEALITPKLAQYTALSQEGTAITRTPEAQRTAAQRTRLTEIIAEINALRADSEFQTEYSKYNTRIELLNTLTDADLDALRAGFISPYGSSKHEEDFVELQSLYITDTEDLWETKLMVAGPGRAIIERKFAIVVDYLKGEWGIDLHALRRVVHRRQSEISTLNLTDTSVN